MESGNKNQDLTEINIIRVLIKRFKFILFFTFLVSFSTYIYFVFSPIPETRYYANVSFVKPHNSGIFQVNKVGFTDETSESTFNEFLNNISSPDFQKKVFLETFPSDSSNLQGVPKTDLEKNAREFLDNIVFKKIEIRESDIKYNLFTPLSYSIYFEGQSSKDNQKFLNNLIEFSREVTTKSILSVRREKIIDRLREISALKVLNENTIKSPMLVELEQAKEDRMITIDNIQIEIQMLQMISKSEKEAELSKLLDEAVMAEQLEIYNNNFSYINNEQNSNLTIAFSDNKLIPKWYLYGEKALRAKYKILKETVDKDELSEELARLNAELFKAQSQTKIKVLQDKLTKELVNELHLQLYHEEEILEKALSEEIKFKVFDYYNSPMIDVVKVDNNNKSFFFIFSIVGFFLSLFISYFREYLDNVNYKYK